MASNHSGKDVMETGSTEGNNSEATVEIKIKTLDSQTYTLRVDKCVPVPALKEQIASVTGVLSDQQRLICRGKVLKDDQLLSAYHVEDGHTLHLVARQPINPALANFSDQTASDAAASSNRGSQHGPSVVVGTFNISEQGDGSLPDFSRIVSAVLGSFGIANGGNGSEAAVDLQQHISERLSRIPGLNDIRSSTGQQPEDASGRGHSQTLPTDVTMESLQLPVIPDALTTLSQYLRRLRQEFNDNVRIQGNNSQPVGGGEGSHSAAASQGGLPTPAALGEVTQATRQLLIEQAGECLTQLTRQLGDQTNISDPVARLRMQSNALRSGALLQNLGAFLLELGRTTMTLRMGQTPTDAVVNAGPAVFISTSGPNPIMVQPLPFQPGSSFGPQISGGGATFSVGSGLRPRNIDIRIRTAVNQREASVGDRSTTDPPPPPPASAAASEGGNSSRSFTQTQTRVVPIRISTVTPVITRTRRVDSRYATHPNSAPHQPAPQPSQLNGTSTTAPAPAPAHTHTHGVLHNGESVSTEVPSGLDDLLRNLFPPDHNHNNNHNHRTEFVFHGLPDPLETPPREAEAEAPPRVTDEGTFLSNLLHQIMPVVSQHINQPSSTNGEENQDRGAGSSRQPDDPPTSKRQKTDE